jgi:HSF-type DNA-binding
VKPAKKKSTTEDETKAIDTAAGKDESLAPAQKEEQDGVEDAERKDKNVALDEDDEDSKDDSEQKEGMSMKRSTFPERLMELLTNGIAKDAMWWLPNGDSFAIQPKKFSDTILNKYFQGTKLESFTRKMNRW